MPYNNSSILPSKEPTGQTALPLARIKKILQLDEDTGPCSNSAAFVITIATEMFIRYLAESAQNVAKTESKPRRNVQYKDLANAVSRLDNLEFLVDVVPRTTTYREYKRKKAAKESSKSSRALQAGQTLLDGNRPRSTSIAEQIITVDDDEDEEMALDAEKVENEELPRSEASRTNGEIVFQHYEPNGRSSRTIPDSEDVEMG